MCPAGPALGLFVVSYWMIVAIDSIQSFDLIRCTAGWQLLLRPHQSICYLLYQAPANRARGKKKKSNWQIANGNSAISNWQMAIGQTSDLSVPGKTSEPQRPTQEPKRTIHRQASRDQEVTADLRGCTRILVCGHLAICHLLIANC